MSPTSAETTSASDIRPQPDLTQRRTLTRPFHVNGRVNLTHVGAPGCRPARATRCDCVQRMIWTGAGGGGEAAGAIGEPAAAGPVEERPSPLSRRPPPGMTPPSGLRFGPDPP